jgi:hypothetical protein
VLCKRQQGLTASPSGALSIKFNRAAGETPSPVVLNLTIARRRNGWALPMKVWPHVGASLAASLAYELRFEIGEPDVIRPWISADRDRVAALVIRAVD